MEDSVDLIISQWAKARPDLDVSAMGILGRLSRLTRHLEREQQHLFSKHQLQPGEFDILATLLRADTEHRGLTVGQLTASVMVTGGAVTNRLDRLAGKGLITRTTDPHNRRTIRISLTAAGREVIDAALLDHVFNEERLLVTLTYSERQILEGLLRTMLSEHESR
ncbi:MarR family winged helix-turn-helix transcriptional regulator [Psychromicrobium xiongbiense]|uniref:MarR family winged helix-turn-helix transcriptional regulator n=1 Tax=Psychromicrobium xiongbiense TaxID=3051184 RepID=UPI00255541F2|nr:MarR family transcriptional regulator [Psychromicrobium sp. YIM S02556]